MKISKMANAVGYMDDELITAAAEERKKKIKHNLLMKWGSIAACLVVLVTAGAVILPSFFGAESNNRYKNLLVETESLAIVWPWEYRTIGEKYSELKIDGVTYLGRGRPVSENLLGVFIGTYTVTGYDETTEEEHAEDFEVYQLKNADRSQFAAVKMDGTYYVFKNAQYDPPRTLGELFDLVDIPKVVELNRFSENGDGPSRDHFMLTNAEYVWDVLSSCREAVFVEDQMWHVADREYLSFSITSETLGVYKNAMYVTADGYLWTNMFDWQYLFYIGEEAAGDIIKYVKENSVEAEYEPYNTSIAGEVMEITADYILIDDTILCNDPEEGLSYKVLLNDLRISRYVDYGIIEVGDMVQVCYEGEIAEGIISSAISADKVTIYDGDIVVPE